MRDHAGAMLYRPEAFEPLIDDPWDAERVRAAIRPSRRPDRRRLRPAAALAGTRMGRLAGCRRPSRISTSAPQECSGRSIGSGSGGVADTRLDLAGAARATLARLARASPTSCARRSYPAPRSRRSSPERPGILLVAWRLTGDRALADDLHARVSPNVENEAEEVMWGTPRHARRGSAHARVDGRGAMAGRGRRGSADALWARRDERGLWTQRLERPHVRGLATAHGSSATSRRSGRRSTTGVGPTSTARRTPCWLPGPVEEGLANWPGTVRDALVPEHGDDEMRLQWCSGAPGVVDRRPAPTSSRSCSWPARGSRGGRSQPTRRRDFGICHGTSRERLRVARGLRADRRRGVALPRPPVRGARARSGGGRSQGASRSGRAIPAPRCSRRTASRAGPDTRSSAEHRRPRRVDSRP